MANTLHDISFDRTSTSSRKSQGPFLNKLKSGILKLINRHCRSSIDTFRPKKHHYSPVRQHSLSEIDGFYRYDDDDHDTNSQDDLGSISDNGINSELQHNIYFKDDEVERLRYNKTTCYHHQHKHRPSTISILSPPPSILAKRSSTHSSSNHQHSNSLQNSYTKSLQCSSVISASGSSNSGKSIHNHHFRQYSHISFMSASNMTINSEDLTAKEFADMAGIRIIHDTDNDDDAQYGEVQPNDTLATSTTTETSPSLAPGGYQQQPSSQLNQASDETNWSVVSSGTQQSQQSVPAAASKTINTTTKIWDAGFWKQPCTEHYTSAVLKKSITQKKTAQKQPLLPVDGKLPILKKQRSALLQHRQTLSLPSPMTTTTPFQHAKSKSNCDFPIIHELRRIHSVSNNNQQHANDATYDEPCVIRKGRFEIQLEP